MQAPFLNSRTKICATLRLSPPFGSQIEREAFTKRNDFRNHHDNNNNNANESFDGIPLEITDINAKMTNLKETILFNLFGNE
jgi:hypothetical protein